MHNGSAQLATHDSRPDVRVEPGTSIRQRGPLALSSTAMCLVSFMILSACAGEETIDPARSVSDSSGVVTDASESSGDGDKLGNDAVEPDSVADVLIPDADGEASSAGPSDTSGPGQTLDTSTGLPDTGYISDTGHTPDPSHTPDTSEMGGQDTSYQPDTGAPILSCAALKQLPYATPPPWLSCSGSWSCGYGSECCCGVCKPEFMYSCTYGVITKAAVKSCAAAATLCSPGCQTGEFTISGGCTSCQAIDAGVKAATSKALNAAGGCLVDADCTLLSAPQHCALACPIATPVAKKQSVQQALEAASKLWCPSANVAKGCKINLACAQGEARCVKGICAVVKPCDPAYDPPGTACDDGDLCTTQSTCDANATCTGSKVSCDDGDPCTQDSCDAKKGCLHKLLKGDRCTSSVACSLGGTCQASGCVDAGLLGWKRTWPGAVQEGYMNHDINAAGGLVMTFRGTGTVYLQSRNLHGLVGWLSPMLSA